MQSHAFMYRLNGFIQIGKILSLVPLNNELLNVILTKTYRLFCANVFHSQSAG